MARRRRESPADFSDQVDEPAVRLRAARFAFLMAGGLCRVEDHNGPDAGWWERWRNRTPPQRADVEARAAHYLEAIDHLNADALFESHLARCRRQAQLNTPAARAARRHQARRAA